MNGQWKRSSDEVAVQDDDDEWYRQYQQMVRDEIEIQEHLERVTNVPILNVDPFVQFEIVNDERTRDVDSDCSSSSSEIVIADHLQNQGVDDNSPTTPIQQTPIVRTDLFDFFDNELTDNELLVLQRLDDQQNLLTKQLEDVKKRLDDADNQLDEQYDYIEFLEKRLNNLDQYGRRQNERRFQVYQTR